MVGQGVPSDPARPKYPVGPNETRDLRFGWQYQADGTVDVFVNGTEPPEFASNEDVELLETLPDVE